MDLKEIQNLIKFVANSGVAEVKLEMDDVKVTIRTTLEGNATETTYVQQMPAQPVLQQAVAPAAAPVAAAPVVINLTQNQENTQQQKAGGTTTIIKEKIVEKPVEKKAKKSETEDAPW